MITVYLVPKPCITKPCTTIFEPTFLSDTLFGAIATAGALLGYKIEKWLDDETLRISNTFPFCLENEKKIHYFPKPVLPIGLNGQYELLCNQKSDLEMFCKIKKLKKIKWLKEDDFEQVIRAGNLDFFYRRKIEGSAEEINDKKYVRSRIVPRNTVNRLTLQVEEGFYAREEFFFAEGWGLFFLVSASEEVMSEVKASLRLVADRGIGGDISTGRGAFNVNIENGLPIDTTGIDAKKTMVLSLYIPKRKEIQYIKADGSYYTIALRKGFISVSGVNRVFKKRVLAINSGSIIDTIPDNIVGKREIVAEKAMTGLNYDVIFYGRPFTLPVGG